MTAQVRTFLLLLLAISFSGCQSMGPNARGGSALGGTSGALAGAAIGSRNGNTIEGALLGGAIGTLAGATVGDSMDELEYRDQVAHQQALASQQLAAVNPDQLLQMTTSGLSEELIVSQIQTGGVATRLTTNDLIALRQRGVSDRVLSAYQKAGLGNGTPAHTYSTPVAVPMAVPGPMVVPYGGIYRGRPRRGPYYPPGPPRARRARGNSFGVHIGF